MSWTAGGTNEIWARKCSTSLKNLGSEGVASVKHPLLRGFQARGRLLVPSKCLLCLPASPQVLPHWEVPNATPQPPLSVLLLPTQVTLSYGVFEGKLNVIKLQGPFSPEEDPSRWVLGLKLRMGGVGAEPRHPKMGVQEGGSGGGVPALPLACCVILGKCLALSGP